MTTFNRLFDISVEKQRIGHDLMYRGHFKIMILITFSEVTAFVGTEINGTDVQCLRREQIVVTDVCFLPN